MTWPATRMTLLDRLRDRTDHRAWGLFLDLYGPLVFQFARRRLPQDEDAADVMQEVLSAVLRGQYQRGQGRFQKWLVTVLLNKIRDFHAARARRGEVSGGAAVAERLEEAPSPIEEDEWGRERERRLFHLAAERVRARSNPVHWEAFAQTAVVGRPAAEVAAALDLTVSNVYAIKCRLTKEIRDEVRQFDED